MPVLVYGGFCLWLFVRQRDILFLRQPPAPISGDSHLEIPIESGFLHVTVLNPGQTCAAIYFGGNAEAVNESIPEYRTWIGVWTLYLVHYRGFGHSDGVPSESSIKADALRVFDAVRDQHQTLITAGRSLGSGVALYLASARAIDGLMIVSPYDSLARVAARHYPWFPVSWLMKDPFHMVESAKKVTCPTLVLFAEDDDVIPPLHTHTLLKALHAAQVEVHAFANHNHQTISEDARYIPTFQAFLARFETAIQQAG